MKNYVDLKKVKLSLFVALVLTLLGFVYLLLIDLGISIPCFFYKLTGFYCPGCGITRMFLSMLCLDFYQAFRFNPFLFILLPFFLILGIFQYERWLFNQKYVVIPNFVWNSLLIITILYGILRNLDIFSFLAPTLIH